jgi:protein ImuA
MNRSTFAWLKQRFPPSVTPRAGGLVPVRLGAERLDSALLGGLPRGALHEIYAKRGADASAAAGFAAALGRRAAGRRPILWAAQDFLGVEAGRLYPPGLAHWGLDPSAFIEVETRDALGVLRAGADAARCGALGAVVIGFWGHTRPYDLTATRRLSLAAAEFGVPVFALHIAAEPKPSAAATRWAVEPAPSHAREARAPGDPRFALTLLRHRGGVEPDTWIVEWSRERGCFIEVDPASSIAAGGGAAPLSGAVVSLSADRSAEPRSARALGIARTG